MCQKAAQNELASILRRPKDYLEAAKWFRMSAEQGDAWGRLKYGLLLSSGEGVPQNYSDARTWLTKSADQGEENAQEVLGIMYESGLGVGKDYVEAFKWFSLSAAHDNTNAEAGRARIIINMTAEQVAESQRRVAAFTVRKQGNQ